MSAQGLIQLADHAVTLRRFDELRLISQVMADRRKYRAIADYYSGLAVQNNGQGDLRQAQALFERAAENAPAEFRARAILSLGAVERFKGNPYAYLSYFEDVSRIPQADISTRIEAQRAIALLMSIEGDHRRALAILEGIMPAARAIARFNPRLYLDVLNSLAVELHATGRLEEAARIARTVCASPLSNVYPEWRETGQEIGDDIRELERRAILVVVKSVKRIRRTARLLFIAILVFLCIRRAKAGAVKARPLTIHVIERVRLCARTRDGPSRLPPSQDNGVRN